MTKGELAKEYFEKGYNCAQSVALSFKDEMGLDETTVAKLASSFGGGVARMREMCGAVSGGAFVLGMLKGYSDPSASVEKQEHYTRVREYIAKFQNECGSYICRELLQGVPHTDGAVPEKRTDAYYKKRPCGELCMLSADFVEQTLKGE
ncbi:MAG: C-GCAxxG-C-C family protein [Christensenellales bacterium]